MLRPALMMQMVKRKVLMVAPEAAPVVEVGGLADVVGADCDSQIPRLGRT